MARGWDTLPAQSAEYVLNDINSGLPAVHVHLSMFLSPFDPRVFGHNDIVFMSRAGRASQYPLSWRGPLKQLSLAAQKSNRAGR